MSPETRAVERPVVLGIETSCDETAAAVVARTDDGGTDRILSSIVASQSKLHERWGGVVPEVACRAHLETILPVVQESLAKASVAREQLTGIAATYGPGLVGALLVGLSAAKALAFAWDLPFTAVNHIHGHVYAVRMAHPDAEYPHVVLVASGGHTAIYVSRSPLELRLVGSTVDDAAGEAFDKVGSILGLGYPGGPRVECAAKDGNPKAFAFPRSGFGAGSFDFSFSGIKTAVLYHCRGQNAPKGGALRPDVNVADVAASFQAAMVDVLVERTLAAAAAFRVPTVAISGGVAANGALREALARRAPRSVRVCIPPMSLCTDNAAMIAGLGARRLDAGLEDDLSIEADPTPIRAEV
ncbi:MAG: tRNA (adenosine(37)-N6)-threonylcarbamoyltransferase complex transferase subunit TsaD [Planctomycetes bacterium]|nr:tRNA (adenosine(37)-N6)-threonylcarbamoyltransferase complex transferase subunit TsaD [Planctomycetota bacterium]